MILDVKFLFQGLEEIKADAKRAWTHIFLLKLRDRNTNTDALLEWFDKGVEGGAHGKRYFSLDTALKLIHRLLSENNLKDAAKVLGLFTLIYL